MSVTEVSVKFIWTQTFGRIFTEVGTWSESRRMEKAYGELEVVNRWEGKTMGIEVSD